MTTIALSPQDLLLRVARATVGASEVPPASNAGPFVERCLKLTGLGAGNPWCAAFLADLGIAALGAEWPVPRTASCYQLGEWAKQKGVLRLTPSPGAIFLMHVASLKRFAHTGLIVSVNPDGSCKTLEGNTSNPAAADTREGWVVAEKRRTFGSSDRFAQWWEAMH